MSTFEIFVIVGLLLNILIQIAIILTNSEK